MIVTLIGIISSGGSGCRVQSNKRGTTATALLPNCPGQCGTERDEADGQQPKTLKFQGRPIDGRF
jgi:hypothetical protein